MLSNLERRVGKVGEEVNFCGVSHMVYKVLVWALSGNHRLSAIAEHRQLHSIGKS